MAETTASQGKGPVSRGFGTFNGVFVPSILTVLGVIMYLRMGWVVGHLGYFQTAIVVTLSSCVTLLTALSIASTATNTKVGAGGAYFIVSRSFGIESGAAVGIPLYLAQALGVAFYVTGFEESIERLFPVLESFPVGMTTLCLLSLLAFLSSDLALKTQLIIFVIIGGSIVSLGMGEATSERLEMPTNVALHGEGFWTVFAVFFPAVTGILSGVSMSGDLKNPGRALPLGTVASVLIGYAVYLYVPWVLWNRASSEQLVSDSLVMKHISWWDDAIYAGIWGATLSSALGSLLAAPRTLKALADDRVLPKWLGHVQNGDPRRATVVSFLIAAAAVVLGDLNQIAPVLSMFFLTTYGILNLVAGAETLVGSPSWRPTFRTHWGVSITGAVVCLGIMLMINPLATYIALLVCSGVYFWVKRRDIQVRFTDMRPGMLLYSIRRSVYQLARLGVSERAWRPNVVLVCGTPNQALPAVELAADLSNQRGFTTLAVALTDEQDLDKLRSKEKTVVKWLDDRGLTALVKITSGLDDIALTQRMLEFYGIGNVRPNLFVYDLDQSDSDVAKLCGCLQRVYNRRANAVVVRSGGLASLSEITKHVERPRIHIWWGLRDEKNCMLILTLAHMLRESSNWSQASISIYSILNSDGERLAAENTLGKLLGESRLRNVTTSLILKGDRDVFQIIEDNATHADITMLGIPRPSDELDIETGFQNLLMGTKGLGFTLYMLAGEDVNLKRVFLDDENFT
jgi:amino acid transporter